MNIMVILIDLVNALTMLISTS